ncbi:MAG: hypothetical protein JNL56_05345 [Alphaproteobacteria bacterium]|nr:hypothetical protein [Alphaproteobacteria bacterium]
MRFVPALAPLALLLALAPARAQIAAAPDPAQHYTDLVTCYVAYEQDKSQAAARGDRAREARRGAQIPPVLTQIGAAGQAIGKDQAGIEADLKRAMDAWFAGLAAGTVTPADLDASVAACEAWLGAPP